MKGAGWTAHPCRPPRLCPPSGAEAPDLRRRYDPSGVVPSCWVSVNPGPMSQ